MGFKIGVTGLWHLGCVISVSWSKLGFNTIGFDYDKERVEKLKAKKPPIFEPLLEEEIANGFKHDLLKYSSELKDLSDCDFIFLSYDTPVREDDSSDLAILQKSVADASQIMKDGAVIIVSSQSPVGYCNELRNILHEYNPALDIAYSPENLRLGEAIKCYLDPGRIILGTHSEETQEKCKQLFSTITENIITMNLESAELVKHGINSFLAMSIVFANNLAEICEDNKARIDDVVKGIKSDERIGPKAYLSPGIGFSGGTLGRDLVVLNEKNKLTNGYADLFGFLHSSNNKRKNVIVEKVKKIFGSYRDKTIGVLGLTYKPGTSTLRRSLPLEIVDLLLSNDIKVRVYDPKADYSELKGDIKFTVEKSISDLALNVDLLLLLTDWKEFIEFDWNKISSEDKKVILLDTKNCLDENYLKEIGIQYYSIGRGE